MSYRSKIIHRDRCIDMGAGKGLKASAALDNFAAFVDKEFPGLGDGDVPSRSEGELNAIFRWWRSDGDEG